MAIALEGYSWSNSDNIPLVVEMNLQQCNLCELAEKKFGAIGAMVLLEAAIDSHCRYTGSDVCVRVGTMPLEHVAIAMEGCGLSATGTGQWAAAPRNPLPSLSTEAVSWGSPTASRGSTPATRTPGSGASTLSPTSSTRST